MTNSSRARTYKTEAIILKRISIGEADRIITALTKRRGKIRCVAKGVRKPTSRKSASLELFTKSRVFLAKGRNLDIVTQAEIIEDFPNIRSSLKAAKAAYHIAELTDLLTVENQDSGNVYDGLSELLRSINGRGFASRREIREFEKKLFHELGFGFPEDGSEESVRAFIEEIVEKRLSSIEIFKNV
jgi:DNA repair protein RecO (recombination protein O)